MTEFVHAQAYCPRCRRNVFDTAPNELRNCQIGPVTQAVAVYLRHCVKLSYRDIEKVFKGLFAMPLIPSVGELVWPRLFTFLEVNHMPPTNNLAEQALRLPVILRKITFGSRSLYGAQNMAINLSLLDTAKRQQHCPINLLKSILLNGSKTSMDELFSSSGIEPIDSS